MLPDIYVDLANPQSVQPLLYKVFPSWSSNNTAALHPQQQLIDDTEDPIFIEQLTGGITNKLFQVTHAPSGAKVLIRAYGKGTSAIIDRDREVSTHMHLHSVGLAPPLYARFGNGLVYAYMPGKAVNYQYLSDPTVARAIARRISQWHRKLNPAAIESLIVAQKQSRSAASGGEAKPETFPKNMWELLASWIECMPENLVKGVTRKDLRSELQWIKTNLGNLGGDLVTAHCDLLAGNVIVPEDWVPTPRMSTPSPDRRNAPTSSSTSSTAASTPKKELEVAFIDYEYAMLAPRAFDLANHFMEWQGFDCVTELIPDPSKSNPVLRSWAASYLDVKEATATSSSATTAATKQIDELLDQVLAYWGMPGFYWGIWSAIQSVISDIDFDYASYANSRLQEYWEWKKGYTASTSA